VHTDFGTRTAILVGDYLFAQSSWHLAHLENLEVIKLISQVIKDFASGEIRQAGTLFDTETKLEKYEEKIFRKTATLMAASCRSAAVFSNVEDDVKHCMYEYGRHVGQAFQIVDDVLDFV
jgi:all-trans-nonaprenyl-diphosphate synthase